MEEVKKIGWGNIKKCDIHIEVLFNGDLMIFMPQLQPDPNINYIYTDIALGMSRLRELLSDIYDVCEKHGRTMIW